MSDSETRLERVTVRLSQEKLDALENLENFGNRSVAIREAVDRLLEEEPREEDD